jgi:hypothetical protein
VAFPIAEAPMARRRTFCRSPVDPPSAEDVTPGAVASVISLL